MVKICFEKRLLAKPVPPLWHPVSQGKLICLELDPGMSVSELIQSCGLEFAQPMVALVNDSTADLTQILEEGDQVRLIPQIAGGSS
jgi:sulfur carrier protein ThiS